MVGPRAARFHLASRADDNERAPMSQFSLTIHARVHRGARLALRTAAVAILALLGAVCAPRPGTRAAAASSTTAPLRRNEETPTMQITRAGTQPSNRGPADWFTGTVRIDPLFTTPAPGRAAGAAVTFEPGARTAWHTHPLGQTLVVLSGLGRAQREGGPLEEIRPGDVVWFAPDEKHWHGASPATA